MDDLIGSGRKECLINRFFKDSIPRFAFPIYELHYWGRGEWSPLTAFEGCLSLFNSVKS